MSPVSRLARLLLALHAAVMVALGVWSFIKPEEVAAMTGMDASDQALQNIGLGNIAVGWYQLIFAAQGNRRMMLSTVPLRLGFAVVMGYWEKPPLVMYELCVVWFSLVAVFA